MTFMRWPRGRPASPSRRMPPLEGHRQLSSVDPIKTFPRVIFTVALMLVTSAEMEIYLVAIG